VLALPGQISVQELKFPPVTQAEDKALKKFNPNKKQAALSECVS